MFWEFLNSFQKVFKRDCPIEYMEEVIENITEPNLSESKEDKKFFVTPELVNSWKEHYLLEGHSFHSMKTYYNYIRRFVGYGIEVNQKTVDRFRSKNMSSASAGAIKNFLSYLVLKKEFPREMQFIYFDKSKSTKKIPEKISPLEVDKIINAIEDIKFKNLTLVIYTLALRVSEGLKLKWSDFNYATWLQDRTKDGSVQLKQTKGGKFRVIPVPVFLMEKLYNEHKERNSLGLPIGKDVRFDLVFDFGIADYFQGMKKGEEEEKRYDYIVVHAEDRFRKMLYKVSKEIIGKRVNPHQLRHSKAQELLDKGLPLNVLKTLLGHVNLNTTEIYAQSSSESLRKEMEKLAIQT